MADIKHFDPDAVLDVVVRLFWRQGAASTSVQDIVTATGLNRSSLYTTFGGKQELYRSALRRYVESRSVPVFQSLAEDERGLPAIAEFFSRLIDSRCAGEFAGWGCLVSNAHVGAENSDPYIHAVLDEYHRRLRQALHAALATAESLGQLAPGTSPDAACDVLALLAYGVNLRSLTGSDTRSLRHTVAGALNLLDGRAAGEPGSVLSSDV